MHIICFILCTYIAISDAFHSSSGDVLQFLMQFMCACWHHQYDLDRELANVLGGSDRVDVLVIKVFDKFGWLASRRGTIVSITVMGYDERVHGWVRRDF